MTLTFVDETQTAQTMEHISAILYGPKGVGKSTAAASAPGPIVYVNADAPGRLRFARRHHPGKEIREVRLRGRASPTDPATARNTLGDAYLYVRDGNEVQTVVLDPLGRIYDLVLDDIGGQRPTLQNHMDAQTFMDRYVGSLLELPVHVILVAHDHGYKVATTESGEDVFELFPFCGSGSNPALAKKLLRPVDVVGYCGVIPDGATSSEEGGFAPGTRVAQLFHAGGRQGADGLGVLGDWAELDLSAWVAANAAANAPTESKGKEKKA